MPAWMNDPWIQAAALPAAVALALTLTIRLIGGSGRGAVLANAAVGLATLVGYAAIAGLPVFPPADALQKLAYLGVAGLLLGLFLDLFKAPRATFWVVLALWPALVVAWVAEPQLAGMHLPGLIATGALWFGGILVFSRLEGNRDDGINASVMLLVAALGTAGLALIGGAQMLAMLGLALAAAIGGFLICNWPIARYPFGNAVLFGGGTVLLGLATAAALYTSAPPIAELILLPLFFADGPMSRADLGGGLFGRAVAPFFLAAAAMVPVLVALGVALLIAPIPA